VKVEGGRNGGGGGGGECELRTAQLRRFPRKDKPSKTKHVSEALGPNSKRKTQEEQRRREGAVKLIKTLNSTKKDISGKNGAKTIARGCKYLGGEGMTRGKGDLGGVS